MIRRGVGNTKRHPKQPEESIFSTKVSGGNSEMTFKAKITFLALIPLVFVAAATAFITRYQAEILSAQETETIKQGLVDAKKRSIKDYVTLARASIQQIIDNSELDEHSARERVKVVLNSLKYGHEIDDGYFFVYDQQGTNLVHPDLEHLVGTNVYQLQDSRGDFVIQSLLRIANEGGGFHTYRWKKPSTNREEDKISYVMKVDRWNWMLGTGFYLDDVAKEVTIIEQQVKTNISRMFYLVLLLIGLSTIPLGLLINWRETRLADARIQASAQRFIALQVKERRRFARELHDGINQFMAAAKYHVGLAIRQAEKGCVNDPNQLRLASDVISDAIREIRHISHDLRPALLDSMGLEAALNHLINQFSERTGIASDIEYKSDGDQFPDSIATSLYRIVQEALSNIEKHACATQVILKVRTEGRAVFLDIKDDGVGLSTDERQNKAGIGLRNMQERVSLLSGQFILKSSPETGTHIGVILPLGRQA